MAKQACYDAAVVASVRDETDIVPCDDYDKLGPNEICLGARSEMLLNVLRVRYGRVPLGRVWVHAELASSLRQGLLFLMFLQRSSQPAAAHGPRFAYVLLHRYFPGSDREPSPRRIALAAATELRPCKTRGRPLTRAPASRRSPP